MYVVLVQRHQINRAFNCQLIATEMQNYKSTHDCGFSSNENFTTSTFEIY
jgi:hypothetical protein